MLRLSFMRFPISFHVTEHIDDHTKFKIRNFTFMEIIAFAYNLN